MPEQQNDTVTDTDDEIDDDDTAEQDGDSGEEGGEPEWTPPTKEQWEEQQKALAAAQAKTKRANEQARKLREAKQQAAAAASGDGAATPDSADLAKWQARAVRASAKVQLIARGADADMVELALGRLKPGEVEFDSDDEPDLADWLDDMEDRFPKLFKQAEPQAAPARPKAGKVETPAGRGPRPKMSLGEQIMANSQVGMRRR